MLRALRGLVGATSPSRVRVASDATEDSSCSDEVVVFGLTADTLVEFSRLVREGRGSARRRTLDERYCVSEDGEWFVRDETMSYPAHVVETPVEEILGRPSLSVDETPEVDGDPCNLTFGTGNSEYSATPPGEEERWDRETSGIARAARARPVVMSVDTARTGSFGKQPQSPLVFF